MGTNCSNTTRLSLFRPFCSDMHEQAGGYLTRKSALFGQHPYDNAWTSATSNSNGNSKDKVLLRTTGEDGNGCYARIIPILRLQPDGCSLLDDE
jgi:hypothetical protein